MDKDFLTLLNLSRSNLKSRDSLKRYLKESGIKGNLRKNALHIFDVKRQHIKQEVMVNNFISLIELDGIKVKEKKEGRGYNKLYGYYREIETEPDRHPLKILNELAIALKTNNLEWIKKLCRKLLNASTLQFAIYLDPSSMDNKSFTKFSGALFKMLTSLKEKTKDEKLVRMLATKIADFLPTLSKKKMISTFDANWSLKELREIMASREYGGRAIGFWFHTLEGRTTKAEVDQFLDSAIKRGVLKRLPIEDFWLFKHYYPGDARRDQLEKRFIKLIEKKKDIVDKLIILELLEREAIKKKLASIKGHYKKATFQIKRDIYKEVLESGRPSDFALYNLFLIGEKNPNLFWWFVL